MKIGIVSSTQQACPPKGYGSEAATYDLACALVKLGHDVTLFAPPGSLVPPGGALLSIPRTPDGLTAKGGEAYPVTKYADVTKSLDVLHDFSLSFGAHEAACRVFSCGERGPAHLCTLNGISYVDPRRPHQHNVVVVSEAARLHADGRGAWYGTNYNETLWCGELDDPAAAHVVRYGRDPDFYRPVAPRAVDDYVLFVGRPHVAKGVGLVLDLAEIWTRQKFVLAWRADLPDHRIHERELLARARALPNVEFVQLPIDGHHEKKRDLMASARVLIHPNVYVDACPVVPIEAQLCGTPVVAWDRGGLRECCVPDETAVLRSLPHRYWEHRGEAALKLKQMCLEAFDLDRSAVRAYALRDLTAERMARDYVKVYEAVAQR